MDFIAQVQLGIVETRNGRVRVVAAQDDMGQDWVLLHAETASGDHAVEFIRPEDARTLAALLTNGAACKVVPRVEIERA